MTNREIKSLYNYNRKPKRVRNDWKANRKGRQYILYPDFDLDYYYAMIGDWVEIPRENKRETAFMSESEVEYDVDV